MTQQSGLAPDPRDSPKREAPFKPVTLPSVGLPKAGGSLRGLGEKFQAGSATGTGSMQIPLPVSPCRDVQPALSLSYDSGHPNGPFGIGWDISVPNIARRTDKGIPRYADADGSDIFILSGQEDLVPVLAGQEDSWTPVSATDGPYLVDAYRPRVEGLFARIERRTHAVTGDAHWRSITADNVTSCYGLSAGARITDPGNPVHVFKWLLEATCDAYGHVTFYEYKAEDLDGVSGSDPAEASRLANPPVNRYLKRIHYGSKTPLATRDPGYPDLAALDWLFEVVLDYGEHTTDLPAEAGPWAVRQDPFSSYRSGFEIRTYRLCQRMLMFHEIPEELGAPARLVRATELGYDQDPAITYLTSVCGAGYAWDADGTVTTAYTPTLILDYTRVGALSTVVESVDQRSLAQAPSGIDDRNYQFVDLDGEGIAGILTAAADPAPALMYKRNLGQGRFAGAEPLPAQPSLQSITGDVQLLSLNADGRLDVARLAGPTPGFFERTRQFGWASFATFGSLPKIDFGARGVRFLDVDGDGLTDILVAQDDVFVWFPSLSRTGYGPPRRVTQVHDRDRGAVVLTTEDYETVFLADMSGDGLSDLVRIRNGDIRYWPNLGYGRFGRPVVMRDAPVFDPPDLFDPRHIRLGDLDGTGCSDIVYLTSRGATVYLNQAGNGWAVGTRVPLPHIDSMAQVRIADLLGTGTSCLVWSSGDPASASSALRYIDLLRSTKPHLLNSIVNGMGAQTTIAYAPSTGFYLQDRLAGRSWATRLPFVVPTVGTVTSVDQVALTESVLRYRYAHGFYDGVEREFRGFARVDTWDAVSMSSDHGAGRPPAQIDLADGEYNLPPVHTISWFHTGAWNGERDDLRATLSAEFYAADPLAVTLPPATMPAGLLPESMREAFRSLKGRPLRREVYAEDGSAAAPAPYTVTDYRYEVSQLQPMAANPHGVYRPFERERLTYRYERDPADPRIEHELSLEVDPLGHVVRQARLAYARRNPAEPEQGQVIATCTSNTFAPLIPLPYDYLHGVPTEVFSYELSVASTAAPLPFASVDTAMTGAQVLPFDAALTVGSMRVIEHLRHQYWSDDLTAALPVGSCQTRPLVYDHLALACPATLVASVFGGNVTAAELTGGAGYVSPDGDYWTHAGLTTYDAAHFYQAVSFTDPFGNTSNVAYDDPRLFVVEEHTSADPAFDNVTTVTMDYRVMLPAVLTDPNGNRNAVAFDPLGMVVATAVMGVAGAGEGDTLADPTTRVEYDLLAWEAASPSPAYTHVYRRQLHGPTNPGWLETYSYSDGSGHEVLRKAQAEPDASNNSRWAGTGRTVFDNKGNAIKKYEPYFAADAGYDTELGLTMSGYCEILRYDPMSRLIRVDHPDGTFVTSEFDAWSESLADGNDNVLASAWYQDASTRPPSDPLNRAAVLAAADADTPTVRAVDPLGRMFLSVADNGTAGKYPTRYRLDVQGKTVAVTDPLGHQTVAQVFDAQGNTLSRATPETGTSLTIGNGGSQPYLAWDARGYARRTVYDTLRRMTQLFVTPPGGAQMLAEQAVYGEGLATPNFRGRLYQYFDSAGVLTSAAYDFEGHVTHTTRQLASQYQATPSWDMLAAVTNPAAFLPAATAAGALETDLFDTWTAYDALNRAISLTMHDQTDIAISYNQAGLTGAISAFLGGGTAASAIVTEVDYNARGQRTGVSFGNGLVTQLTYDDRTRMILRLQTTRRSDGAGLQDLNYTYDAAGNIVQVTDNAQQTNFFAGSVTSGTQLFTFDAIYRLATATGREQPGQVGYALGPDGYPEPPFGTIPHRNDLQALLAYTESYAYDAAGNLLATVHTAGGAGWTRSQAYLAGGNKLDRVSLPGDPANGPYSGVYQHDVAGNIVQMPNLTKLTWDYAERLRAADLAGGGTAYFAYDTAGRRIRKIVQRAGQVTERVYIDQFERYRVRSGTSATTGTLKLERETVHVSDGSRRFAIVETKTLDVTVRNLTPVPLFRYQFPNQVGSACLEGDDSGQPISYEEYYPYGGSCYRAGDIDKRYRFTGKERDEETGLYCMGVRYYAPWLSRWISCDPGGPADGYNLYQYARSNPVRYSDPTGFQSSDNDGSSQMSLTALGYTNSAFQAQYNILTLRTEFVSVLTLQQSTDLPKLTLPTFAQTVSVADRLSGNVEVNVLGSWGPGSNGSLGMGLHLGPPQPEPDGNVKRGLGLWATFSQVWGLAPPVFLRPPGWPFNPTLNAFGAYSIQLPNKRGVDFNAGAQVSRWNEIIGVPVGGFVSPFIGINGFVNTDDNTTVNLETTVARNYGLGGRQDVPGSEGTPKSSTIVLGLAWQRMFENSDWGIGAEIYGSYEGFSNITNSTGSGHDWSGGIRFELGAINPRRNQPLRVGD